MVAPVKMESIIIPVIARQDLLVQTARAVLILVTAVLARMKQPVKIWTVTTNVIAKLDLQGSIVANLLIGAPAVPVRMEVGVSNTEPATTATVPRDGLENFVTSKKSHVKLQPMRVVYQFQACVKTADAAETMELHILVTVLKVSGAHIVNMNLMPALPILA